MNTPSTEAAPPLHRTLSDVFFALLLENGRKIEGEGEHEDEEERIVIQSSVEWAAPLFGTPGLWGSAGMRRRAGVEFFLCLEGGAV